MTDDAGFAPIPDAAWPEELRDMMPGFATGLNVYRTMAHHPRLLRAWSDLRQHIVHDTSLGGELSEIAILRTGFRLGSSYEWAQHIVRARARGVSDARIAGTRGPCAEMEPLDGIVACAVDELLDRHALSPDSVAAIERLLGKPAVLDLIATVGFYAILAYQLNSFGVPLDTDIADELDRNPLAVPGD